MGFESQRMLEAHFSWYGKVRRVMVSNSKVKSMHTGKNDSRIRPGSQLVIEQWKLPKERDSVFIKYLDDKNTECILNQERIFDALTESNHPIIHFRVYLSAEAGGKHSYANDCKKAAASCVLEAANGGVRQGQRFICFLEASRSSARKLCLKLSPLKMVLDAFGRGLRAAIRAVFTAEYLGGVVGRSIWAEYLGGVSGGDSGGVFGRRIWAEYLGGVSGGVFGRSIWAEYLGGVFGRSIWAEFRAEYSGGVFGRRIWAEYLGGVSGGVFGRSIWAEYSGGVFGHDINGLVERFTPSRIQRNERGKTVQGLQLELLLGEARNAIKKDFEEAEVAARDELAAEKNVEETKVAAWDGIAPAMAATKLDIEEAKIAAGLDAVDAMVAARQEVEAVTAANKLDVKGAMAVDKNDAAEALLAAKKVVEEARVAARQEVERAMAAAKREIGNAKVTARTDVEEAKIAVKKDFEEEKVADRDEIAAAKAATKLDVEEAKIAAKLDAEDAKDAARQEVEAVTAANKLDVKAAMAVSKNDVDEALLAAKKDVEEAKVAARQEVEKGMAATKREISNALVAAQTDVEEAKIAVKKNVEGAKFAARDVFAAAMAATKLDIEEAKLAAKLDAEDLKDAARQEVEAATAASKLDVKAAMVVAKNDVDEAMIAAKKDVEEAKVAARQEVERAMAAAKREIGNAIGAAQTDVEETQIAVKKDVEEAKVAARDEIAAAKAATKLDVEDAKIAAEPDAEDAKDAARQEVEAVTAANKLDVKAAIVARIFADEARLVAKKDVEGAKVVAKEEVERAMAATYREVSDAVVAAQTDVEEAKIAAKKDVEEAKVAARDEIAAVNAATKLDVEDAKIAAVLGAGDAKDAARQEVEAVTAANKLYVNAAMTVAKDFVDEAMLAAKKDVEEAKVAAKKEVERAMAAASRETSNAVGAAQTDVEEAKDAAKKDVQEAKVAAGDEIAATDEGKLWGRLEAVAVTVLLQTGLAFTSDREYRLAGAWRTPPLKLRASSVSTEYCTPGAVCASQGIVVEFLIERRSDPMARTTDGKSCLDITEEKHDMAMQALLKKLMQKRSSSGGGTKVGVEDLESGQRQGEEPQKEEGIFKSLMKDKAAHKMFPVFWLICVSMALFEYIMDLRAMSYEAAPWASLLFELGVPASVAIFFLVALKDPGRVPARPQGNSGVEELMKSLDTPAADDTPPDFNRLCTTTWVMKGLRTKYCTQTLACVEDFDHYCIWLNCAIGRGNHREFVCLAVVEWLTQLTYIRLTWCMAHHLVPYQSLGSWLVGVVTGYPLLTLIASSLAPLKCGFADDKMPSCPGCLQAAAETGALDFWWNWKTTPEVDFFGIPEEIAKQVTAMVSGIHLPTDATWQAGRDQTCHECRLGSPLRPHKGLSAGAPRCDLVAAGFSAGVAPAIVSPSMAGDAKGTVSCVNVDPAQPNSIKICHGWLREFKRSALEMQCTNFNGIGVNCWDVIDHIQIHAYARTAAEVKKKVAGYYEEFKEDFEGLNGRKKKTLWLTEVSMGSNDVAEIVPFVQDLMNSEDGLTNREKFGYVEKVSWFSSFSFPSFKIGEYEPREHEVWSSSLFFPYGQLSGVGQTFFHFCKQAAGSGRLLQEESRHVLV
ncbi:unnamed protein product [Polarella glacialis]|uniref:Palmitoyltransferase DHHC domain-containing protein n=1 Tax=Polarella glacialis TaxID=89957 RepID=A0A813HW06_POLGL|nr:unnamed protein product [Polarella glacialis]